MMRYVSYFEKQLYDILLQGIPNENGKFTAKKRGTRKKRMWFKGAITEVWSFSQGKYQTQRFIDKSSFERVVLVNAANDI